MAHYQSIIANFRLTIRQFLNYFPTLRVCNVLNIMTQKEKKKRRNKELYLQRFHHLAQSVSNELNQMIGLILVALMQNDSRRMDRAQL